MKKLIILFLFAVSIQFSHSQTVGIGPDTTPNTSAMLDVNGTRGFLPPRMTYAQRTAIASPATGLMVYQTNTNTTPSSTPGLYIKESTAWQHLATLDDIAIPSSTSWTVSGSNQFSAVTGNVGIGTNSPTSKLHVDGNTLVDGSLTILNDFASLYFRSGGSNKAFLQLRDPNFDLRVGTIGFNTTGKLFLQTNGTDRLTIEPLGNVGIGTVNPTTKLQVAGSIKAEGSVTVEDGIFQMRNSTDGLNWTLLFGTGANRLRFLANGLERVSFLNNGLVGIGTDTPQDKLEVYDGNITMNNAGGTFRLQAGSVDKGFLQLNGDNLRIGTYSSNNAGRLIFRVNGFDAMEVTAAGKTVTYGETIIGANAIVTGTTTMNGKLTVNQGLEAIRLTGNDPAINFFQSNIQRGYLWATGNDMNLGASVSTGKLFLNASQINMQTAQVTIGTSIATPSTYKLGVGGRIICEELKVKLQSAGWPDYVFANNYKLKPLDEVENFIKINKHLPNIPSAQVIDKEGLEVGEMQRRMMEKIEELTLYVIDLKKEIEVLKAK